MASIVKIKRSSVQGKTPTTDDIQSGELALNTRDGKLFSSDGSNVFEVGSNNAVSGIGFLTVGTANPYTFPESDGTSGQVLKTDGAGNLTFQDDDTITEVTTDVETANTVTIDAFSANTYSSAEYNLQVINPAGSKFTKLLIHHNGSDIGLVEYGEITLGDDASVGSIDARLNLGNVELRFTHSTDYSDSVVKFTKQLITTSNVGSSFISSNTDLETTSLGTIDLETSNSSLINLGSV